MARAAGGPPPFLKTRLLEDGPSHAFAQALRLLRRIVAAEAGTGARDQLWRRVTVRPHLAMGFATSDVRAIRQREGDPPGYEMTVEFLGLYGASSPLPNFYTEDLLEEQSAQGSSSRDFIDIFNSAIYPLHFESWGKHRLFYALIEAADPAAWERLFCLLGFQRPAGLCELEPRGLLSYLGLFGQGARPAEGLRGLLADHFGEASFRIRQCVARTARIAGHQRCRLGLANHALGQDACLGSRIQDATGKFRIELGPVSAATMQRFLPGQPAFRALAELVRLYARDPLAWDLRIILGPGQARGARLGAGAWSALGRDTWLLGPGPAPQLAVEVPEPGAGAATFRP
jgi:type VI secretion system protein ImpH